METLLAGLHRPRLMAQLGSQLAWVDKDPAAQSADPLALLSGADGEGPLRIRGVRAPTEPAQEYVRALAEVRALVLRPGQLVWARRQTVRQLTLATGATAEVATLPGELAGLRDDGAGALYLAWNSGAPGIARVDLERRALVALARPTCEVRLFDVHHGRAVWLDELTRTVFAATEGEAACPVASFDAEAHLLALHAGELWLGVGHSLRRLDAQGRELSRTRLPGPACAIAFSPGHTFVASRAAEATRQARVGAALWRLEPDGPPTCLHAAAPRSGGGAFGLLGSRIFEGLAWCEGRLLALDSGAARDDGALISVDPDGPAVEPVLLAQHGGGAAS